LLIATQCSYRFTIGKIDCVIQPVDLIHQKKFRNPIFEEEVEKSKTLLYAA